MKLKHVGLERCDDLFQQRVVGIHDQRDLFCPILDAGSERPRSLKRDVPRARRKEHKTDHVGARIERDIEILGRRKAADFD